MIIAISGLPGAGKSELAKRLADKLDWPRYNMGQLRRQKARDKGLTLAEYNKLGESDPRTDLEVDHYQAELGRLEDNFIIEGRTSWHFIPQALKVFLTVEPHVGAKRIYGHLEESAERNEGPRPQDATAVEAMVEQRMKSDRQRYQQYFNFDAYDPEHHDLVLDTTKLSLEQVLNLVYQFIEPKLKN